MQRRIGRKYPTYSDDIYTTTVGEEEGLLDDDGGPLEGDPGDIKSRSHLLHPGASSPADTTAANVAQPSVFQPSKKPVRSRAQDTEEEFGLFSNFEFSLGEIGRSLRSPRLIFVSIFVIIGATIAWAQVQRSASVEQFRVSTTISPPANLDVVELYVPNFKTDVSAADVFQRFTSNMEQSVAQGSFVSEDVELADINVSVRSSDEGVPFSAEISVFSEDPDNTQLWLTRFIDYLAVQTVTNIIDEVNSDIQSEIEGLQDKIRTQTEISARDSEEKIDRYLAALSIAQENGIMVPVDTKLVSRDQRLSNDPLYLQGYWNLERSLQELRGEIDGNGRQFAEDENRIEELSNIAINKDQVRVMRRGEIGVSQAAGGGSILLFVLLGAIGGWIVGRFLASKIAVLQQ